MGLSTASKQQVTWDRGWREASSKGGPRRWVCANGEEVRKQLPVRGMRPETTQLLEEEELTVHEGRL